MKKAMGVKSPKSGSFTVLMTSLSLLLLAFFIFLNSTAVIDNRKLRMALGSLRGTFGVVEGGMGKLLGGSGSPGTGGVQKWSRSDRSNLFEGEAKESLKIFDETIQEAGLEAQMDITVTEEGTHISLEGEVLFASGSATLTSQGRQVLAGMGNIIRATDGPVRIEGHTDNVPIHTEAYPSNWELSTARAVDVLRYFIEEKAIPSEKLSAEGFADTRPRVPNDTPGNRSKNRRVNFVLLGQFI
jgi:chemotaxis protein MotB